MRYPIVQYRANETGSVSSFRGLNRTDRGNSGEWLDCLDIDTSHYPCISPRLMHTEIINEDGNTKAVPAGAIRCCCEPLRDNGEYQGFTGVVYSDSCKDQDGNNTANCCFYYNGEVIPVGTVSETETVSSRTALWSYDAVIDGVSDEDIDELDYSRIEWSTVCMNGRIVINGYDPVLKRGKYFVFMPNDDDSTKSKVVPAGGQTKFTGISFGFTRSVTAGYDEFGYVSYFSSTDTVTSNGKSSTIDFGEYFTEGDYIVIRIDDSSIADNASLEKFNVYPYRKASDDKKPSDQRAKYAVVREIVNKYNKDGALIQSRVYYYASTADGTLYHAKGLYKKNSDTTRVESVLGVTATIGTFVPSMSHIAEFGGRIWGCNAEDDCVYASVFDTPFKMMNTDTQLDSAMSWQVKLGSSDTVVGVFPAVSEMLAFKKNSLIRINGTSAASFAITGIFKNCGCIDIRSAAEAAGVVYYLGYNGFYAYDGSQPMVISTKLNCCYKSAVGFTDGDKYYALAVRRDNSETEFLVYDIRYGVWHKWTAIENAVGAFRVGEILYLATSCISKTEISSEIYSMCSDERHEAWECESVEDFEGVNNFKGINELYIRAEIHKNEWLIVYTSVNGEDWKVHEALEPKGRVYLYKVPVRIAPGDYWQYKLTGSGGAVVHNIEYGYTDNGRRHYGNR